MTVLLVEHGGWIRVRTMDGPRKEVIEDQGQLFEYESTELWDRKWALWYRQKGLEK